MNTPQTRKSDELYEVIRCKRNKGVLDALVQADDHPALSKPSWRRWNKAMAQIEAAMIQIESEMETYHDHHTRRWRNGKRAYDLVERLTELQAAKDAITAWVS